MQLTQTIINLFARCLEVKEYVDVNPTTGARNVGGDEKMRGGFGQEDKTNNIIDSCAPTASEKLPDSPKADITQDENCYVFNCFLIRSEITNLPC